MVKIRFQGYKKLNAGAYMLVGSSSLVKECCVSPIPKEEHGLLISNGYTLICLIKLLMLDIVDTAKSNPFVCGHVRVRHAYTGTCTHACNMPLCLH
jgi:hypothetical protein